jgi:hypothetical protein
MFTPMMGTPSVACRATERSVPSPPKVISRSAFVPSSAFAEQGPRSFSLSAVPKSKQTVYPRPRRSSAVLPAKSSASCEVIFAEMPMVRIGLLRTVISARARSR